VLEHLESGSKEGYHLSCIINEHIAEASEPVPFILKESQVKEVSYRPQPSIMSSTLGGDRQEFLNAGLSTMWAVSQTKSNQVSIMKESSTIGKQSAKQTL
jgi:hypothetical protein